MKEHSIVSPSVPGSNIKNNKPLAVVAAQGARAIKWLSGKNKRY